MHLTKRSRGILNAWHFQFDSVLVFTAQWFRFGGGVAHPLTRRYAFQEWIRSNGSISFFK